MKVKSLLIGLSFFSLTGCLKTEDLDLNKSKGVEIDGTYGIALFNDNFTALKILKRLDSLNKIFINDEGYISYIAGQNSSSLIGNDYIVITNQSEGGSFSLPPAVVTLFNAAPNGTTVSDSSSENWFFDIPPYELDSIIYKSGDLLLETSSTFTIPMEVTITIEDLLRPNGALFSHTLILSGAGSNQATIDMSGFKADFTLKGTNHSRLRLKTKVSMTKNSGADFVTGVQQISYNVGVSNQVFKKIHGYFGQEPLVIPTDTLEVDLYQSATGDGDIRIEEPRLNLYFDNSYGMGVRINTLSPFFGRKGDGTVIPITGVSLPFTIDRANTVGETKRSTLILKEPEVNINEIADAYVKEIEFGASATINPGGVAKNFALDTSRVTLTSEIEIPFYGSFKNFNIETETNFTPPKDADILEFAEIKLIIENTFAFGLSFQVYFMDSMNNTVDSLFKTIEQTNIIPTASVDNTGKVINAAFKTTFIKLDQALLKKMQAQNVTKLKVRVEALSFNQGNTPVKVYPENGIIIKAGLKVKIKGIVKPE